MGRLDPFMDITGDMNPLEVNAQNISNIVDELNRNSDQLDALNNNLNIIAYNKLSVTWNGIGGGAGTTVQDQLRTGSASTFLAFYDRSDIPNTLFSVPNIHYNNSGNMTCFVTGDTFVSGTAAIGFQVFFASNGSPISFNFYYYILQQPANAIKA